MSGKYDHSLKSLSASLRDITSKKTIDIVQLDKLCAKFSHVIDRHCADLKDPKRAYALGQRLYRAKPSDPSTISSSLGKIAREHKLDTFTSNMPTSRKSSTARRRENMSRDQRR